VHVLTTFTVHIQPSALTVALRRNQVTRDRLFNPVLWTEHNDHVGSRKCISFVRNLSPNASKFYKAFLLT